MLRGLPGYLSDLNCRAKTLKTISIQELVKFVAARQNRNHQFIYHANSAIHITLGLAMTPICATVLGIGLQLFGAIYLVYQAKKTARSLANYKGPVTFDTFSPAIEALTKELSSQYSQQLIGFLFLFAGSAFQLYAAITA